MNATSLRADSKLTSVVVAIAEAILLKAKECAIVDDRDIVSDDSVFTFVTVIRNLRIDVVGDTVIKAVFSQPTSASRSWISLVDPFLLAEALREINVDLSIVVFDVGSETRVATKGTMRT